MKPPTVAVWTRRIFLVRATCATCAIGVLPGSLRRLAAQPVEGMVEGLRNLPLGELQKMFHAPTHLSAYEYFTAGRGLGAAELVGAPASVRVGQVVPEVVLRYRAPKEGILPGGYLRFWLPNGTDLPVIKEGNPPSKVEVTVGGENAEASVEQVAFMKQYGIKRPETLRVIRVPLPAGLPPEGEVLLTWRRMKAGNQAPNWGGTPLLFRVYADHDANGFDEEVAARPSIMLQPDPVARLLARCASTAVVGEPVRVTLAALDAFDNPASGYSGEIGIAVDEGDKDAAVLPGPCRVESAKHACAETSVTFNKPGLYWLKAVDEAKGFTTVCNPVEVFAEAAAERLYWGDIHYHTEFSADARAAGCSPDYASTYEIGRRRYGLDFMAATDHHAIEQGNYGPEDWAAMQKITNTANDPGRFATLVAVELSGQKGDQNIYFAGDSGPFFDHNGGDPDERDKDWAALAEYDCIAPPHHFAQSMRPWDWTKTNPTLQPICEIFSHHGRAEYPGNDPHFSPHPKPTLPGRTWVDQLNAGRKLGAIASSDDHAGRPGTCGLAAVWAPALTRKDIHHALKTRRCYASTDSRTILNFSADGHAMGETFETKSPPVFHLRAAAPNAIREIHIVKNGMSVHSVKPGTRFSEWDWTDPDFSADTYYYARLHLEPNPDCTARIFRGGREDLVWSSPIWIRALEI